MEMDFYLYNSQQHNLCGNPIIVIIIVVGWLVGFMYIILLSWGLFII